MPVIIFIFLCCSVLFYPSIGIFRVEYVLVLVVIIFFGGAKIFGALRTFKFEIIMLLLLLFCSMLGLLNQSITTGSVAHRDYMLIFRFGFYLSMFLFSGIVCYKLKNYEIDILSFYMFGSILFFVTLAQYYNLFGINQLIQPYAPEDIERMKILVEQAGWRRAVGTLGNPNYWGLLLSMLACVVSYRLFWEKRWIYAPLLLGLLGSILLTGSRSALVAYLGALVVGGGLFFFAVNKKPSMVVAAFFAVLAVVAIVRLDFSSGVETSGRYSLDRLDTLEMRVAVWGRILDEMTERPISFVVGQGTRKDANVVGYADNAYIKILREHGLVSLIPYLFLIGFMIRRTLRLVKSIDDENRAWPGGLCLLLLAWAIFDLSADTWYGPRLMGVIFGLYAFVHTVGANRLGDKPVHASVAATDKVKDLSHI